MLYSDFGDASNFMMDRDLTMANKMFTLNPFNQ